MGGNRPLIPLSFIAEGAKWLVCPDQGMAMVLPAPSYRPAKMARVQATYAIPFHSEGGGGDTPKDYIELQGRGSIWFNPSIDKLSKKIQGTTVCTQIED